MRLHEDQVPLYTADGRPLGFRSRVAAERWLAGGFVTPSFGRKGHLKAIHLRREDGLSPVEATPTIGTRYSFEQRLQSGRHCWKLKQLDLIDENGVRISSEALYRAALLDCLRS